MRFALIFNDVLQFFTGGNRFILVQPGDLFGQEKVGLLTTRIVWLTGEVPQTHLSAALLIVYQTANDVSCAASDTGRYLDDLGTTMGTLLPAG